MHEASNTTKTLPVQPTLSDETQSYTSTQCQQMWGPLLSLRCICRIEELEKAHAQLNGERQRLQEDLEEVQERLTAGHPSPSSSPLSFASDHMAMQSCAIALLCNNLHESNSPACCSALSLCVINFGTFCNVCRITYRPCYCFPLQSTI